MYEKEDKNRKKIKKSIIRIFSTIALGLIFSILVSILLRSSSYYWEWDLYQKYLSNQSSALFWLEIGIIMVIYLWFTSLLRSKWGAVSLLLTISVSLAIANQQKMIIREEPIYPSDFDMIKVLPEIMGMVDFKIVILSITFVLIMLVISGLLIRREWSRRKHHSDKRYSFFAMISFIVISLGIVTFYNFNQPGNIVRAAFDPHAEWIHWSQRENYQKNGFISGFLYNLPGQTIEEPNNYTTDKLDEIVGKYTQIAAEQNKRHQGKKEINPNILFIMNESFSDPKNLKEVSLSNDPIPYFSELSEEYLGGNVLISGYGGGTANAEFEALTGISIEPLSPRISTPYIQMSHLMARTPNIVSRLKDKGYQTTAIHPYNTTMYKRPNVYNSLGFDQFIYDEKMNSLDYYENNQHVSDLSSYEEVLDQMKKTAEKDFIHLVTMHGHTPYEDNYERLPFKVDGKISNEDAEIMEQYYQGLAYSDQDLNFLIEEINLIDEDTLIVFWGDHLPGIYPDNIFTKQHKIDMFEAPVLFYANFESEEFEKDIGITTPFYFMNHLSNISEEPISGYTAFMQELEKNLTAFKRGLYVEASTGKIKTDRNQLTEESQQLLNHYDIILYDLLEGKQYATELGFFKTP